MLKSQNERKGGINSHSVPVEVIHEVIRCFTSAAGNAKPSVQSVADHVVRVFGDLLPNGLTREQIYPLLWEGFRRKIVRLCSPIEVTISQRVRDFYRLVGKEIHVANANGRADAVAQAAADALHRLIRAKWECGTLSVGLTGGMLCKHTMRSLRSLLQSEFNCPSFIVHPLDPPGFLLAHPNEAASTFALYLECQSNSVILEPHISGGELELVVCDVELGLHNSIPPAESTVLVAGPRSAASLEPWLRSPKFTHAILDLRTAIEVLGVG